MLGKKVEYYECDYEELETLVKKKYDIEYNFVEVEECGNDSQHTFAVDGKLSEYDKKSWKKIFENELVDSYQNGLVLNKLCADGHIPCGKYIVRVCW